jgi:hypothetical protein
VPSEPGLLGAKPARAIRHVDLGGGDILSPEAYDGAYTDLISRVRSAAPEDEQIRVFREELREALSDPARLPDNELFKAVDFGDGSDQAFLRRLWHDLYGDEPV